MVTVAYLALVSMAQHIPQSGTDADQAQWLPVHQLPPLAFDHAAIVETALIRLRNEIQSSLIGFTLLPREFLLRDLQKLHEQVLDQTLDKRNFRKKWLETSILEPTGSVEANVQHRAAQLYRLTAEAYRRLQKEN